MGKEYDLLRDAYRDYLVGGAENDPTGSKGNAIAEAVVRAAGGIDKIAEWLEMPTYWTSLREIAFRPFAEREAQEHVTYVELKRRLQELKRAGCNVGEIKGNKRKLWEILHQARQSITNHI